MSSRGQSPSSSSLTFDMDSQKSGARFQTCCPVKQRLWTMKSMFQYVCIYTHTIQHLKVWMTDSGFRHTVYTSVQNPTTNTSLTHGLCNRWEFMIKPGLTCCREAYQQWGFLLRLLQGRLIRTHSLCGWMVCFPAALTGCQNRSVLQGAGGEPPVCRKTWWVHNFPTECVCVCVCSVCHTELLTHATYTLVAM